MIINVQKERQPKIIEVCQHGAVCRQAEQMLDNRVADTQRAISERDALVIFNEQSQV